MAICEVIMLDSGCLLDAGRKECFSCGNPCCGACSQFAKIYYRWRHKRICNDCISDRFDDIKAKQIVLTEGVPEGAIDLHL